MNVFPLTVYHKYSYLQAFLAGLYNIYFCSFFNIYYSFCLAYMLKLFLEIHLVVRCFTLGPYFNYLKYGKWGVHMKGISSGVYYHTCSSISPYRRYYYNHQKVIYRLYYNLKNTYSSLNRYFSV